MCAAGLAAGGLTYWHNHSEDIQRVFDAFTEATGISVEHLQLTPDDMAQRVLLEHGAGRQPTPDVIAGGLDIFLAVIDAGLADEDFDYSAFGVPEDRVSETGNMARTHRIVFGLGYNPETTSADELPDTWEELIDERWKGRVVVDPRGRPFDQMALEWGKDAALDYVRRFKDVVEPLVIEGGTAGLLAVASGEALLTTGGRSAETLEQQADGVPVDIKYLDFMATNDSYRLLLKGSKNLDAARCYTLWFALEGGQELYDEIEFKSNETVPSQAPSNATLVTIDSPDEAALVKAVGKDLGAIWTGE